MRLKADLILLGVAVIWGMGFIAQDIAASHGSAYLFNGASFFIAGVVLFLGSTAHGEGRQAFQSREQWMWMSIAGSVLFAATIFQQVGLFYTKIANAGFLTSLYTVFIPFLLWILYHEKPRKVDILAVGMAVGGAYLLSTGGKFTYQAGDLLEILGAIFASIHFIVIGKFATKYAPISFAAGQFLVTGVLSIAVGLFTENLRVFAQPPFLGAIIFRSLFPIGLGFTLQIWGQRHTAPFDAGIILSLESVFAFVFAWLLLGQQLGVVQMLGCFIILCAVLASQLVFRENTV